MSALIEVILPVFIVIACGYIAVFKGFFSDTAIDGLMRFSQNFAIPVLLFRAISTLDLSHGFDTGLLTSYYTGSISVFTLGILGARYLFNRPLEDAVAIGFSALFANAVLLGLPIMERAYGAASLAPNYAIVSLHAPVCYFLGITTMEVIRNRGHGLRGTAIAVSRAMFRNVLTIAIALGFIMNFTGLITPAPITDAMNLIVHAALPTALFALGGVLYRYRPDGDFREVGWVCFLSLVVHPSIALFLTTQVFHLPTGLVRAAVLTASMAPGMNSYMFANMYGRARRVAATSVLVGTLASILSVTVWLAILGV
ncbi:MAG: AEC family transporter [Proteobacteria bacterium]|nr:AEC family transporter [Pseudomonadota bacterium]